MKFALDSNPDESIEIDEHFESMHHGTTVWESSIALLRYLIPLINDAPSKTRLQRYRDGAWLDIGAGLGLLGITLVKLAGVKHVVMTDQPEIVQFMRANVEKNGIDLDACRPAVLMWGDIVQARELGRKFDFITATDVLYDAKCVQPVIQSILEMSHDGTQVFVGHEERDHQVTKLFIDAVVETRVFSTPKPVPRRKTQVTDECMVIYTFKRCR